MRKCKLHLETLNKMVFETLRFKAYSKKIMKKKYWHLFPLLFTAFLVLYSCSNDNSPQEEGIETEEESPDAEVYFTLNVDEGYFSNENQNWVVIHFSNGDIADYRAIRNDTSYVFEKLPSEIQNNNAFNVTFISMETSNGNSYNSISTITLVGRGDVYNLTKSEQQNAGDPHGELIGNFDLNVESLISPASTTISNKGGPIGGGAQSETVNGLTNYRFYDVNLYDENRYLFSLYDSFGRGSHLFLDNIVDGESITIDRTQLMPYNQIVPVAVPENGEFFAQVLAFEEGQAVSPGGGYVLCLVFPFDGENFTSNIFELGYLNGFETYYTAFTFRNDDFFYNFKKTGDIPISINIPQGNFDTTVAITDESLTQLFSYESSLDRLSSRKSALWSTTSGTFGQDYVRTTWSVLTGQNPFPITSNLPDEILQSNPTLGIENLSYESMRFYLTDISYYDYINAFYVNNDKTVLDNFEYIEVFR